MTKAEQKRVNREKKHAIYNTRLAEIKGKRRTTAQAKAEARVYADRMLAQMRQEAEVLSV